MTTVYLHIGAHKTGTTALQYFLWNNRKRLRKEGYLYPKFGMGGYSHGVLGNVIKPNNRDPKLPEHRHRFREEVLNSKYDKIVLSSEVFLEGLNVAAAARDFFPREYCDVKVIAYLRNQADWLESVFHEIVRDPYRRYTGDVPHMREYEQGLHDYARMLQPWIDEFGETALVLCPYETAKSDGGILSHLLAFLGIQDPTGFDFTVAKENQNLRLHALASEFLRRVNRFPLLNGEHKDVVEDLQRISPDIGQRFGEKFRLLNPATVGALAEEFADRNRHLFRTYSRYGAVPLFGDSGDTPKTPDVGSNFGPDTQHALIDALKPSTRALLEDLIPKVKNRQRGQACLPPPPRDQEKRLNEVIMRQRFELRRLYQKHGDRG